MGHGIRGGRADFFWGDPDPELVEAAHGGGALVSWQVGSAAEAVAAERAGCDFIIAQGIEAGGHIRGTLGLLPLLSQVLDRVAPCGTGFVAAPESGAHPVYVEAMCCYGGQSVGDVHAVRPATEIVAELVGAAARAPTWPRHARPWRDQVGMSACEVASKAWRPAPDVEASAVPTSA
jgi:hypothetical protein